MAIEAELGDEQAAVDAMYARLDELRALTARRLAAVRREGPSGSPQNRSERDAFATLYEDRLAQLEAVEDRLVFGRLDMSDGTVRYIGRIGLTDDEQRTLLTDWRAPAAQAFYRATAAHPEGVTRRRHVVTRGRTVTGVEDELLDLSLAADGQPGRSRVLVEGLSGEGALLASLAAGRTGRMGDIVATIQAEQDEIIRSDLRGALVVQGGPGTGKTAVALHRAAYLLYAHRERLQRSGVLLVGPSRTFLRYIDQVLPSLGETGVVTTTMADLLPGVTAVAEEPDAVAEVKGRAVLARVIARAVRQRQRVPDHDTPVHLDGRTVMVRAEDIASAITRARRGGRPHNEARVAFVRDMLGQLADQYVSQLRSAIAPDDRADLVEELRTTREVRVALNLAWMPLTPQGLLADLFAKPDRLAAAAPELTGAERALLARPRDAACTPADVPLLDEAAELLGEDDQAERAEARTDVRRRAAEVDYARQVIEQTGASLVSAELLADRFAARGPALTTAERAAADRTWTYGHVIVDEAQELSEMAWRALLRRVPTRSLTIVGDVAQTTSPAGTHDWAARLDPVLAGSWRATELTVNYRTPASVAQAASAMATAAGLPVSPLVSARDVPEALAIRRVERGQAAATAAEEATAALALVSAAGGPGRVAVIGTQAALRAVRAALAEAGVAARIGGGSQVLDAPVALLRPREAKGLEFDVVVLVEPSDVLADGAGELYVAMTRPTRALRVVHAGRLPAGLAGSQAPSQGT